MDDHEDEVALPGFRFYPTDEELVGFYLKRKIGKKPISMELIKEIDIYKFDPWDLPKTCTVGDNEWYFYCKRGRKYRNSVRPNRVTGSGFWKATGIDKPIYSATGQAETHRDCIGLKKSLVYYRGSAGKGTKTDWMMHEFRLPDQPSAKTNTVEAEVWTLCRIFKRSASYRKYTSNWREISTKRDNHTRTTTTTTTSTTSNCKTSCVESTTPESTYISFGANDPVSASHTISTERPIQNQMMTYNTSTSLQAPFMTSSSSSYPSFSNMDDESKKNEFFSTSDHWDELGAVLGFYANPFTS